MRSYHGAKRSVSQQIVQLKRPHTAESVPIVLFGTIKVGAPYKLKYPWIASVKLGEYYE